MTGNLFLDDLSGAVISKPVTFRKAPAAANQVTTHPAVDQLLLRNAVVAIGISGGKDSQAVALAVAQYLDKIGHTGPRVLVHADLGRVEWKDSLPVCQRLAEHLGWELLVVRSAAGDLLARWQGRWTNNVARYADLSCVKLILPWSTPQMRFCTSEKKSSPISAALRKRFPTHDIVNVTGIRRQESAQRSRMPVAVENPRLARKGFAGMTWNAIIDCEIGAVFQSIHDAGLELHVGYSKHGVSRISCVFCIMSSASDMLASAQVQANQPVYVEMVELEAASTYGFQGSRWLADVRPDLLPPDLLARVKVAQAVAVQRQALEAQIPAHLLYTKGWPEAMPTLEEATLLASIRCRVADLVGLQIQRNTADSVLQRYAELLAEKSAKAGPLVRRQFQRSARAAQPAT